MGKNSALFRLDNSEGVRESFITVDGKEKVRAWSSVLQIHGECIALTCRDAANLRGLQRPQHEHLCLSMGGGEDEREDSGAKCTRFQINYVPDLHPLLHEKLNELRKRRIPGRLGNDAQGCGIPAHPDLHKPQVKSAVLIDYAKRKSLNPFEILVGLVNEIGWRAPKLSKLNRIEEFKGEAVPIGIICQKCYFYRCIWGRKNHGALCTRGFVGPGPKNRACHNTKEAEDFCAHSKKNMAST